MLRRTGTDYGATAWPLKGAGDGSSIAPVYAWVPSIGVSELIRIEGSMFPAWKEDLLVASLSARTLFRIRIVDDRVLYVEPLPIDRRVRDLVEGPAGEIVLWTDEDELVRLERARSADQGAALFLQRCSGCHRIEDGREHRLGPDLRAVYQRPVASAEGFTYSDALLSLDGVWTADRLRAFLTDPDSFAPGTTMPVAALADSGEVAKIIAFLRTRDQTAACAHRARRRTARSRRLPVSGFRTGPRRWKGSPGRDTRATPR